MRALARDTEIVPENQWTQWQKNHLKWLTTPRPDGDGYTLIENYVPENLPINQRNDRINHLLRFE